MEVTSKTKFDGDRRFGLFGLLCRVLSAGPSLGCCGRGRDSLDQLLCVAPVRRFENSGARPGDPRKGGKVGIADRDQAVANASM